MEQARVEPAPCRSRVQYSAATPLHPQMKLIVHSFAFFMTLVFLLVYALKLPTDVSALKKFPGLYLTLLNLLQHGLQPSARAQTPHDGALAPRMLGPPCIKNPCEHALHTRMVVVVTARRRTNS